MSLKFFTTVSAETRDTRKCSVLSAIRSSKKVPGVIYMKEGDNLSISIDINRFIKLTEDPSCFTRIIEIKCDNKNIFCVFKDINFHPISDLPVHFDLMEVKPKDVLKINVPIKVVNKDKCPGIKTGGDVYILNYSVKLKCEVENIPSSIDIDVSESQIGDKFFLSDLKIPQGCSMVNNIILARVAGKRVIKEIVATDIATDGASSTATTTTQSSQQQAGK
jgi:large subunit ribosomal protein L25